MATLAEIESAALALPLEEQKHLVCTLEKNWQPRPKQISAADREAWMKRLDELRARTKKVCDAETSQRMWDEIREDRI